MSPCQHRGTESFPPSLTLLSCTKSTELADFCAFVVPCIWAGSFKQPSVTAKRYATFKMFCQKVLKATQISCACVLLALYYIHRLRSAYPSIRASIGSEVRLFTTALILANKFLDDNTFTNKTWSDVSSIPVRELNIMEMEFLSALNYNIYIHHQKFFAWATQCQHWVSLMTEQPHHHRPIKMPARLSIKSSTSCSPTSSLLPSVHHLPISTSMPTMLPSTTNTPPSSLLSSVAILPNGVPTPTSSSCSIPPPPPLTTSLKRSAGIQQQQIIEPPTKRRHYHVPYTPPDETMSPYPQTPLYTPPDLRLSLCTSNNNSNSTPNVSNINTPTTTTSTTSNNNSSSSTLCRPILSWSSSSSALASSRHHTNTPTSTSSASSTPHVYSAAGATFSTALLASRVQCLEIE